MDKLPDHLVRRHILEPLEQEHDRHALRCLALTSRRWRNVVDANGVLERYRRYLDPYAVMLANSLRAHVRHQQTYAKHRMPWDAMIRCDAGPTWFQLRDGVLWRNEVAIRDDEDGVRRAALDSLTMALAGQCADNVCAPLTNRLAINAAMRAQTTVTLELLSPKGKTITLTPHQWFFGNTDITWDDADVDVPSWFRGTVVHQSTVDPNVWDPSRTFDPPYESHVYLPWIVRVIASH